MKSLARAASLRCGRLGIDCLSGTAKSWRSIVAAMTPSDSTSQGFQPDGPQELVVGVFDPTNEGSQPRGKQVRKPGGIFYTPTSGIWQTVWMEPVNSAFIEGLHIVPDVDGGKVQITVNARNRGAWRCRNGRCQFQK